MDKKKLIIIISSIICLIPLIYGAIIYPTLPRIIPSRWDYPSGNVTGYTHKGIVTLVTPFFLLALNIYTKVRVFYHQENVYRGIRKFILLWLIPVMAVLMPILMLRNI